MMISSHKWCWCDSRRRRRRRRESDERSHAQCGFVYIISTTRVDYVQMFRNFSIFIFRQEYARNNFIPLYCNTHSQPHIKRGQTCESVHLCLTLGFVCHIFHFGLLSPLITLTEPGKYNRQHQLNYFFVPFSQRNTFNECRRHTPHRTTTRHSGIYRFT